MAEIYNWVEVGLWFLIGTNLWIKSRRSAPTVRRMARIAAVAFFLFSLSDLIETQTGAWWKPWWLLVWKALCVLVFFLCLAQYLRLRRQA